MSALPNTNHALIPVQWNPTGLVVGGRSFTGTSVRLKKCTGMHPGDTITFKVGSIAKPYAPCTLSAATRIAGSRFHVTVT